MSFPPKTKLQGRKPGFKLTDARKQQIANTNRLNAAIRRGNREIEILYKSKLLEVQMRISHNKDIPMEEI